MSEDIKNKNILTYGENKKADYQILNIRYKKDYTVFEALADYFNQF